MAESTFVLIPGAGGSAWYWHRLEPELRQRGHDVVAVDLPAADERAGLAEYADAVVKAMTGNRGARIVLVAQSLGGFTAPLVAARAGVSLIVFLNAMIPTPRETPGEWWEHTGQESARRANDVREGRSPDAAFDALTYFFHDVPREVVEAAFAQGEPRQSAAIFGSPLEIDAWPDVPMRVLIGRDDRFFPREFQQRVAAERLGIGGDEVPGGHLVALSHPVELAEQLTRYAGGLVGRT